MRRLLAASLLVFLAAAPALAEDGEEEDPIDTALTECLDAPDGQSTLGMVQCFGTAYESWDKALNEEYQGLMETLEPEQQAALKAAQRKWLAFRDSEQEFLQTLVTDHSGSIMRVITNEGMADMVKARVLALRLYGSS